jgi:hypothetical protein
MLLLQEHSRGKFQFFSFLFVTTSRRALEPFQPLAQWVQVALPPGKLEADHSLPTGVEIKKLWSCISTSHLFPWRGVCAHGQFYLYTFACFVFGRQMCSQFLPLRQYLANFNLNVYILLEIKRCNPRILIHFDNVGV